MTVSVQVPYTATIANGSTSLFAYNFKCYDEEDLTITLDGAVQTTGFTVSGIGVETGGTVEFTVNPANGVKVLIANNTIPKRDTNYPQFGQLPANVVNQDFDRLWVAVQYLLQKITTAIKLPFDTDIEPVLSEDAATRALKYVGFDAAGGVALSDIPDLAATLAAKIAAEAAAATIVGFEPVGVYTKNTPYLANNLILGVDAVTPDSERAGATYRAVADFTSTNGATDSASLVTDISLGRLVLFAARGASGAGTGDMLAAQNLNDVVDKPTARSNLGLGSAAVKAAGTGAAELPTNADILGKHSIWIPAGAMKPRTTNPPSVGSVETTTNKVMISTLDFDYATQNEYAQFEIRMPTSWDEGTLQAEIVWSCAAGATAFGVVFGVQARAFGDTDTLEAAFGTAGLALDTASSTGDILRAAAVSSPSANITVAGTPVAGDVVKFQIYRDFAHASDTLDKDARLHGVLLTYTVDAHKDA